MVATGDKGLARWTNGGYVFVPSPRPVVGEKCIGYPIVGGGYFAVPLRALSEGDPALGEPYGDGSRRIAVRLDPCSPLIAGFTWTLDENHILHLTDTSTGSYTHAYVGVFADWGLSTYRELHWDLLARPVAVPPIDCSAPGAYYCQWELYMDNDHYYCPYGVYYYYEEDLFTIP